MTRRATLGLTVLLPLVAFAQNERPPVPAGTPLVVTLDRNYPMHAGETIRGDLMYPIYAGNRLILPKGTAVVGSVIRLHADHARRVRAALGGDFTPFHTPEVRFSGIVLSDGTIVSMTTNASVDGAPVYRAVAPPPAKGGLLRHEFDAGLSAARRDVATFTAPGKGDRLLQFVYDRLPYHPERIAAGMAWTVETADQMEVPGQSAQTATPVGAERKRRFWEEPAPANEANAHAGGAWIVQANLAAAISSENSRAGQEIQAVVAEPIYDADNKLVVPQGATLTGTVTRARPARSFGRTGVLSFNFAQLVLPNAETQTVETRLTGADAAAEIALNSEGQATLKPQDKVTIPLFLALLASRPLDLDEGKGGGPHEGPGKDATGGSASLSLIGTIVAAAGGSPYAAAGIGYWGVARAVYSRWLARGQKISFPKDTRIVVETMPRRSGPLKPAVEP